MKSVGMWHVWMDREVCRLFWRGILKESDHLDSFIHSFIHSFILQSVLWQANSLLQSEFSTAKPSDSSFSFQYPLFFLRSSSSYLRLLPHIPFTSLFPSIFHSITFFRRQLLHKTCPNYLAFLFYCRQDDNIKIDLKYIDGGT